MVQLNARISTDQYPREIDDPVDALALAVYNRIDGAEASGLVRAGDVRVDGPAVVITDISEDDADTVDELMTPEDKAAFEREYDEDAMELRYVER